MSDGAQKTTGNRFVVRMLAIVVGAGCFYVLSYGPAMSLANKGFIPNKAFVRFYAPLPLMFQQQLLTLWSRIDSGCQRFQHEGKL